MRWVLGTMFTPNRDQAKLVGFGVHFLNGWIFASLYAAAFESWRRATWWLGGATYLYLLRKEFEEHGCKLRALNDRGDDSPEGELTDGILDQLAKYERAKTAERSRRGKLRKAREGKIIANNGVDYGFRYNEARDGYEIDAETMPVVRRIFAMVADGLPLNAVAERLTREGVGLPYSRYRGVKRWNVTFIRDCIVGDDVYRPHTFEEICTLVRPEVASRLDPDKSYGIWWFNRRRSKTTQISVPDSNSGRRYKQRVRYTLRPREEWIAVPVPDSGFRARSSTPLGRRSSTTVLPLTPGAGSGSSLEASSAAVCAATSWIRTLPQTLDVPCTSTTPAEPATRRVSRLARMVST